MKRLKEQREHSMHDSFDDLRLPPAQGVGICPICRGLNYTEEKLCAECTHISESLQRDLLPASPITMYAKPSAMREWLTYYKETAEAPEDPAAQAALKHLLGVYMPAITAANETGVDLACVVPSTVRQAPHPLVKVFEHVPLPGRLVPGPSRTSAPISHNNPNAEAYAVEPERFDGHRVLLLDDVYTTGARAQSAREALTRAGAHVVGLVVIARRINPEYREEAAVLWNHLSAVPFSVEESVARSVKWSV